ncbi:hypothetical protein OG871_03615 [Kitasatospora sp. NBC_00374]|uniref:hypothetical protein n=1 Tax=Kitasatospora sp. NBC_00374 TaxID=2975964 RepID=UPI0030E5BABE
MGYQDERWQLVRRRGPEPEPLGEIVIEEADFPWLHGRFVPGPAFPVVEPLFIRSAALAEAEDWEAFDQVYEEIRRAVSLRSPSGPVAEFLLHIEGDRAWFRWSDEPFDDEPFGGEPE